ncbi:putative cat eye syndrome critical region protein 9 [Plecturocebus cupreus]
MTGTHHHVHFINFILESYLINKTRSTRKVEEHNWFTCTGARCCAISLAEHTAKEGDSEEHTCTRALWEAKE